MKLCLQAARSSPDGTESVCSLEAKYVAVVRQSGTVLGHACERHVQRLVDTKARAGVSIMLCSQYYTAPAPKTDPGLRRRRGRRLA